MKDYLAECKTINNDRTPFSAFIHAYSEMDELEEELYNKVNGLPEGDDGVVGEATDVILCMLDIISQSYPDLTMAELEEIYFTRKMKKWKDKYGK